MRWDALTVVIPTWNHGLYLGECLESLCNNTLVPGRIVVVDDASTDDTRAVAAQFPVEYRRHATRTGPSVALNEVFAEATTPWVMPMGADDAVCANYFAHHHAVIVGCANPARLALVWAPARIVDGDGIQRGYFADCDWVPGAMQVENFVHGCALVARAAWDACGRFRDEPNEDWRLWQRMDAAGWTGLRVTGTAFLYRQHASGHRNHATDHVRDRDWHGQAVTGLAVPNRMLVDTLARPAA